MIKYVVKRLLLVQRFQDEGANAGSKVVASLFLSPGGPRFTSLMLNLANHIMLQEMKTFRTGVCSALGAVCVRPLRSDGLCWCFFRGQLGSRGRGHTGLLAGHGSQAFGADHQTVSENSCGAGSFPPRVPEESPVSPGGPTPPCRCGNMGLSSKPNLVQDYKEEN